MVAYAGIPATYVSTIVYCYMDAHAYHIVAEEDPFIDWDMLRRNPTALVLVCSWGNYGRPLSGLPVSSRPGIRNAVMIRASLLSGHIGASKPLDNCLYGRSYVVLFFYI